MDRTKIKKYAPQARTDFRKAVQSRLAIYGIRQDGEELVVEPLVRDGASVLIGGRPYPRAVGEKRDLLEKAVRKDGFNQTVERLAYTWFNRLVAIRYMELHGYLDHGYRVLSHPQGKGVPEVLEQAEYVALPGLDKKKVIDLKLDGNKDEELYRLLLIAQCNALHSAMPFLFERVDDETELALPENLLHSDSLVRKLVTEIGEEDWQEVEIIGWLYEAYISERYEQVIGKVVAAEDIPAATQRFTPKWIVRYLVQNTLGRTWLATYPESPLREQMKYYIEPAEQTEEVKGQLKDITPTSLNPEEITFLDPACGSGHILVEAYDLYKAIYQERGYRSRDIPRLILAKNLFGLEIDDRAAQLAAFALLMKARADDVRLFGDEGVDLNILGIRESAGLNARELAEYLNQPVLLDDLPTTGRLFDEPGTLFTRERMAAKGEIDQDDIAAIIGTFEKVKSRGSLVRVPDELAKKLPGIEERTSVVAARGEGFAVRHAAHFLPLVRQARCLDRQFDCVVTNPPYMGGKYLVGELKAWIDESYPDTKADLYACFIKRCQSAAKQAGRIGMITFDKWTYLTPTFTNLRSDLAQQACIESFVHNGRGVFGSDYPTCSFVLRSHRLQGEVGTFRRLFVKQGSVADNEELEARFHSAPNFLASLIDFEEFPGKVIAYWAGPKVLKAFKSNPSLGSVSSPRQGLATTDDSRFLRLWHEVSSLNSKYDSRSSTEARDSRRKWFPFNKGGQFRRWFGNLEHVINWLNNGEELTSLIRARYGSPAKRIYNTEYYFRPGLTWSSVTISVPSFRFFGCGSIISHVGPGIFSETVDLRLLLGYLNSCVVAHFLSFVSPSAHFEVGQVANVPFKLPEQPVSHIVDLLLQLHEEDWNTSETSWSFARSPLLVNGTEGLGLPASHARWQSCCLDRQRRASELEAQNNRAFIDTFELNDELPAAVSDDQITLYRSERTEDVRRLISYTVGCMMGRYGLDKPGLIYANAGGNGFDASQYIRFRADDDGIIPLTEFDWGLSDDVAKRLEEFVATVWSDDTLDENLKFVADSLESKKGESPRETIRRYLATGFYKHHLQMYKRRPIYWLFSSGKLRAFQCLVYLHRYNEGTLSRMRTEYVIPLQGRIAGRIQHLEDERSKPTTSARLKKIQKELDGLKKEQAELRSFDEKLNHYADKRIALDLDEGVKVNYGKFGDLLADVKAVTGGKDDE